MYTDKTNVGLLTMDKQKHCSVIQVHMKLGVYYKLRYSKCSFTNKVFSVGGCPGDHACLIWVSS